MLHWIESLSPRDKVLVIGGGALILLLLVRAFSGAKNSTTSTTPSASDQAQAQSNSQQQFGQSVQNQTAGIMQMIAGYQETQSKAIADLHTQLESQTTDQNNKISGLLSQMSRPIPHSEGTGGYTSPIANNGLGNVIPSMSGGTRLATGDRATDLVLGRSVGGTEGNALVTVKTSNGTANVLAGSVFDPSSSNYNPNL